MWLMIHVLFENERSDYALVQTIQGAYIPKYITFCRRWKRCLNIYHHIKTNLNS